MSKYGNVIADCAHARECNDFCLNAQDVLQDGRSNRQRGNDRIPDLARYIFSRIASCASENERKSLRAQAAAFMQSHRKAIRDERARFTVRTCRVFTKSNKPHHIQGITSEAGHIVRDRTESDRLFQEHYAGNWVLSVLSFLHRS